jgi:predicted O-methyltransferase YrrM
LVAGNEYSIHSPFIYEFYKKCVIASNSIIESGFGYPDIESLRRKLKNDQTVLSYKDPGNDEQLKRTISSLTKTSAKSPRLCRLLAAMIHHFKPKTALELGTSLGISTLYQWKELHDDAKLWTLEGNSAVIPNAQSHFDQFGANNLKLVEGKFSDTLPKVLSEIETIDWAFIDGHHQYQPTLDYFNLIIPKLNENTVIVLDDINWSDGMQGVWKEIIAKPEVTASVDLFFLGVVFFRKNLTKEAFKLRL